VKPLEDLPTLFRCLMTKGEKYQLKLESLAPLCLIMFYLEKSDCPVLSSKTDHLSFLFLVSVDLKRICNV
jgi:hypothetical protein